MPDVVGVNRQGQQETGVSGERVMLDTRFIGMERFIHVESKEKKKEPPYFCL